MSKHPGNHIKVESKKKSERWIEQIYRSLGRPKRGRCPKCGRYVKFELIMHCPRCEILVPHFSPEELHGRIG